MTHFKSWLTAGWAVLALHLGVVEGQCQAPFRAGLEIESGYRTDTIQEGIQFIDHSHMIPYSSIERQLKDLSSIQLGGRGFLEVSDWVVKANGHYGWIVNGEYNADHIEKGRQRGHNIDASTAIGYLYKKIDCFNIAPLVGYSYDQLVARAQHVRALHPTMNTINTQNGTWSAKVFGPWFGVDIYYDATEWCRNMYFISGYEFHCGQAFTHWNETLCEPKGSKFSFTTKQAHMIGHVVRFESQIIIWDNWFAGFDTLYKYWGSTHNSRSRFGQGVDSGLASTQKQDVFKLNWYCFALTLNLGRVF